MNKTSLFPQSDRIHSLDVLRGVAVLGILLMNIQSFSMISAAYINPTAFGDMTGLNKMAWMFTHIFADQKFMSIFSILFGAGIVLFTDNVEDRGYLPARFYYRKLFWLFTFGLIHGYLFWHGDILVMYAVSGALAFLFRKLSPWILLILGGMIFFVPSFNYWLFGKSIAMWPPEAVASINNTWAPGQDAINSEIAALTGGLRSQLIWRIPETFKMESFIFLIWMGWRALAMMMMGMGLLKLGVLSASLSKKNYGIMAITGLSVGILLIVIGIQKNFAAHWAVEYAMFFGWQWNYIGSLFVAIGYIAIIMFLNKISKMSLMAKVGRLAFTNYILMTLICTTLFYGHGFGLFGSVDRAHQLVIVGIIWVVLLAFSYFWSLKFYYGPLEWLWRYLTYGNKPVFKK